MRGAEDATHSQDRQRVTLAPRVPVRRHARLERDCAHALRLWRPRRRGARLCGHVRNRMCRLRWLRKWPLLPRCDEQRAQVGALKYGGEVEHGAVGQGRATVARWWRARVRMVDAPQTQPRARPAREDAPPRPRARHERRRHERRTRLRAPKRPAFKTVPWRLTQRAEGPAQPAATFLLARRGAKGAHWHHCRAESRRHTAANLNRELENVPARMSPPSKHRRAPHQFAPSLFRHVD